MVDIVKPRRVFFNTPLNSPWTHLATRFVASDLAALGT